MEFNVLNPYIENSIGYWRAGGKIYPDEVLNRNAHLEAYRKLYDANFESELRLRLGSVPQEYPLTITNYFQKAVEGLTSLLVQHEPTPTPKSNFGRALAGLLVNYFVYGVGIMAPVVSDDGEIVFVSVSPQFYWQDGDNNQFFAVYRNNKQFELWQYDADAGVYTAWDAFSSAHNHIDELEEVYSTELADAPVIVFGRRGLEEVGNYGVSVLPPLKSLVFEICALDTRISYVGARHGLPLLVANKNAGSGIAEPTPDNPNDNPVDAIKVEILQSVQQGAIIIDEQVYDSMSYLTWDAGVPNFLSYKEGILQQIAMKVGLPSAYFTASGEIFSGSTLSRLYIDTAAVITETQNELLPLLSLVVEVARTLGSEESVPSAWTNIFAEADKVAARPIGEDRPGPETGRGNEPLREGEN